MGTKNHFKNPRVFLFKYFFYFEVVKRKIDCIDSKKTTTKGDVPAKILKWDFDIIAPAFTECFGQNIKNSTFPSELQNAGKSSVYKKKGRHDLSS